MPRLVVPASVAKGAFAAAPTVSTAQADDYKDRLVKYIPAEAVAFYAFVDKLLIAYYGVDVTGAIAKTPDFLLSFLPWVFLALGIVGTPIYLYRQRLQGQPWVLHAVISTIAFPLWAYTLGGSIFLLEHWYHILAAAILAPVFTFVAGWFEPRP